MSVRSAFTIVGAAVGTYFGNPQLGAAIGSLVGNAVDPVRIQGPQIGDTAPQTSRAGIPITLVYGGPIPVTGTLVDTGPKEIITVEEQQGKGGGPVTETEHLVQTFAVMLCINGFQAPDGTALPISGISRVKADGKVVYDVSAQPPAHGVDNYKDLLKAFKESQTASAKFRKSVRFLLGTPDQMPDPALESIHGVGNTPAYRGRVLMIADSMDLFQFGNRIPQFEVDVVGSGGEADAVTVDALMFGGKPYPWSLNSVNVKDPRRAGVTYQYAFQDNSTYTYPGAAGLVYYDSLEELIASGSSPTIVDDGPITVVGWSRATGEGFGAGGYANASLLAPWDTLPDPNDVQEIFLAIAKKAHSSEVESSFINNFAGWGALQSAPAATWVRRMEQRFEVGIGGLGSNVANSGVWLDGPASPTPDGASAVDGLIFAGGVRAWLYPDFGVVCRAIPDCGEGPGDLALTVPDADDTYYDPETRELVIPGDCNIVSGSYKQLQSIATFRPGSPAHGLLTFTRQPVGPAIEVGDPVDTQAFWEAAYADAVDAGYMAAGLDYGVDYPVSVGSACECTPAVPIIEGDQVLLADVQESLCNRAGVPSAQIEVSQLTDGVNAFKIARSTNAADASRVLQQAYMYDAGEWDSKLRFIKRGGPSLFSITDDDLLADDGVEVLTREAGYELPRKFTVVTLSLENHCTPTPQTSERYSPDVLSISDPIVAALPVVMSADETMQVADRMKKIAMADAEGGLRLRVWQKFIKACATDPCTIDGKRFRIDRLNILDGIIEIEEARRDRQSAYSSDRLGVPARDATLPPSTPVRGPTMFVALNLPSLRQQDNVPGQYIVARGVLTGWPGATIQLSKDGGASFTTVATITNPGTMGYLNANLEAGEGSGVEPAYANIFGSVSSVTAEQIANGFNLAAIPYADDTAELLQFQTAVEGEEGQYELSNLTRGVRSTVDGQHYLGDQIALLSGALFVPIDPTYAGRELVWRAVTNGTDADANDTFSVLFLPQFTTVPDVNFLTTNTGEVVTDNAGTYIQVTLP